MATTMQGILQPMRLVQRPHVAYYLLEETQPLNAFLGWHMRLVFHKKITCVHCQTPIRKTFHSGYCFRCFQTLAECDVCLMSPHLCHYDQGTCREPSWGEQYCMQPHTLYLALSSHVKVGISRSYRVQQRWMDQGASLGLRLCEVRSRHQVGLLEHALKTHYSDRTHWQKMLKGDIADEDLQKHAQDVRAKLLEETPLEPEALHWFEDEPIHQFHYPRLDQPFPIKSIDLLKTPEVSGTLIGCKGQYLLLSSGVLNIRKHRGFHVEVFFEEP